MTTTKWVLDPTHSELQFKIKHLMISTVTGQFGVFKATVETTGDNFDTARIDFEADIDSISTNNEQRDAHLKAADFFDAANHPRITFKGENLVAKDNDEYELNGLLTIKGITKPVTLDVELGGIVQDPWGNTRAGFSIKGKINRKDFGVSFSMVSETGGLLLGDDVKILGNAEFVKEVQPEVLAVA